MARIDTMQLENALRDLKYPVTKDELLAQVQQHSMDEQISAAVRQLPNHHFRSAGEITKAINALGSNPRSN